VCFLVLAWDSSYDLKYEYVGLGYVSIFFTSCLMFWSCVGPWVCDTGIDPLLDNAFETNNRTTSTARQQILNKQIYITFTE
jgi:hypothetical protein